MQEASATKKSVDSSESLSNSDSEVQTIRYTKETLLLLRDAELSKRKPEQLGRAWTRIGISVEGLYLILFK